MGMDLYSWGLNKNGQLGIGKQQKPSQMLPTKVKLSNVSSVSTFSNSTLCVTISGKLFCWGSNSKGRLGLPD